MSANGKKRTYRNIYYDVSTVYDGDAAAVTNQQAH